MDILTMHNYVKVEMDKTSSLELPAFEPEEIDYWLNEAIRKFIESRYGGVNPKGKSFEESQKRIDDLRSIVTLFSPTVNTSSEYTNGWRADLPANYLHALAHQVTIAWPPTTQTYSDTSPVEQISHDALYKALHDPFSSHVFHLNHAEPLLFYKENTGADGDIIMISDGNYDITELKLSYLRQPATVLNDLVTPANNVDCDLPEHTHAEIVKMAANMMLENIESPRYQSHTREVATME